MEELIKKEPNIAVAISRTQQLNKTPEEEVKETAQTMATTMTAMTATVTYSG